ncbi:hypothetical protein L596_005577 [Steinernema carpocapsae]|uniref:Helitron helicase-like domain-containing protein n=1 Tax=Steinernema carpocapsae TaxID=34508 RepID=A0A4U8V0W9_STECR|nr:hypothetical protein L596_005577 [Steinernema carpocapsae]
MAIVTEFGAPDLFITFTCNPKWPEILKLKEFMDDMLKKQVLGKVKAFVRVIEFQKRGLPHTHMLLILDDEHKFRTGADVDSVVCAELPYPATEPQLYNIVKSSMMHGPCGTSYRHMQCMQKHGDRCDKDFPKPYSEETVLEEDQKPRYRRRESAPHFVNEHGEHVENEQQNPDVLNHDEVQNYADARYVGPAEACWRLLGYPMQETSHNVERLAIHLEGEQNIMFDEEEDLQVTLDRASAHGYLYKDIPKHFVWNKKDKKWSPRQKGKAIGRIYQVSPTQTECFRLRLLLLNVPGATSYEALRTVRGTDERGNEVVTTYSTFSETAKALGLLRDDEEWERCLRDSAFEHMPFLSIVVLIKRSAVLEMCPVCTPNSNAKWRTISCIVHRLGNEDSSERQ